MKRAFACMLALAILLMGSSAPALEKSVSGYYPTDMCIIGEESFCFAAKDTLLSYQKGEIAREIPCEGALYCDSLNGKVYALCQIGKEIVIRQYGADFSPEAEYNLGKIGTPLDFAANSTYLNVLIMDDTTYDNMLYTYDPLTGELTPREEYSGVSSLAADGDKIAFQCYDGFFEVLALYYPEEEFTAVGMKHPPYGEILLRPGVNACVILTRKQIEYVAWSDGQNSRLSMGVEKLDEMRHLADAEARGIYMYSLAEDEMRFIAFDSITQRTEKALTIVDLGGSVDFYDEAVTANFQTLHPEYSVERRSIASLDQMRLELMSGVSDVDILYLSIQACALIMRSGVFADLRSIEGIREMEESGVYAEWPFRLVESGDGGLYALPSGGNLEIWRINADEFRRLGLEPPEASWTWDDFLALAREAKARDGSTYASAYQYAMLNQYLVENVDLFTGEANFETEQFRHMLEIWKTLIREELIAPIMDFEAEAFFSTDSNFSLEKNAAERLASYITPPLMEEGAEPILNYNGGLMGIYAASDDIDMAGEYLSLYYRYPLENPKTGAPDYLYADPSAYLNIPVNGTLLENLEDAETTLKYMDKARFTLGLTHVLQNVIPEWAKYRDDKQTLDQTVAATTKAANIWLNE